MNEDHVVVQEHVVKKLPTMRLCQVHIAYGDVWMESVLGVVNSQMIKTSFSKTLTKHCSSSADLNYERALAMLRRCFISTGLDDTWRCAQRA